MSDKVFVLVVDSKVLGVFTKEELGKVALADFVLTNAYFDNAALTEHEVQNDEPSRNPLDYPDVVEAIKEHKKIMAIKKMREHVAGLSLREAKELVESVEHQVEKNPIEQTFPPEPRSVIDGEGDRWTRSRDDLYRIAPTDLYGRTLAEIDEMYDGYTVDVF